MRRTTWGEIRHDHVIMHDNPDFIPMLPSGAPDLNVDQSEVDFMKEFRANNVMNNIMVLLKQQPAFESWWFSMMGSDQRENVMRNIQRLLLRELA